MENARANPFGSGNQSVPGGEFSPHQSFASPKIEYAPDSAPVGCSCKQLVHRHAGGRVAGRGGSVSLGCMPGRLCRLHDNVFIGSQIRTELRRTFRFNRLQTSMS